ncbi:hypothetical protein MMC34_003197 [Xylographa carneopallida]|nr:hypothetical protein [Xylographa carneopallida]
MAVAQRQRLERDSASGNDILSRMLQLEKLSQQHRPSISEHPTGSFRNSSLESRNRDLVPKHLSRTPTLDVPVPSPSIPLLRARTSPDHAMKAANDDKKNLIPVLIGQKEATPVQKPHTPTPDICKSPSWSDYNGDRAKKEKKKSEKDKKEMDKERREVEKKQKKADEKQRSATLKAAKRLSKKPPAAMDTQRMPAALIRTSARPSPDSQTSSQAGSRSSSTERRRSSISSLASMLRLSKDSWSKSSSATSEPPSSFKLVSFKPVSVSAPQLGKLSGIETHSRTPSIGTQGSRNSNSDQEYLKDLASFAYQLQLSAQATDEVALELKQINRVRLSVPSLPSSPEQPASVAAPPAKRNDTDTAPETNLKEEKARASQRPVIRRRGSSEDGYFGEKANVLKDYRKAKSDGVKYDERSKRWAEEQPTSGELRELHPQLSSQLSPALVSDAKALLLSPRDGGSYVHKQRMYRQQQSIAGYEDELAFELAGKSKRDEKTQTINDRSSSPVLQKPPSPPPGDQIPRILTSLAKSPLPQKPQASSGQKTSSKTVSPILAPRAQEAPTKSEMAKKKQNLEHMSSGESSDEYHRYLVERTQNLGIKQAKKASRIPKAEKVLGTKLSDGENVPPSKRRSRPNRMGSDDSKLASVPTETAKGWQRRESGHAVEPTQQILRMEKPLTPKVDGRTAGLEMSAVKLSPTTSNSTKSKHHSLPLVPRFSTTPVLPTIGHQSPTLPAEPSSILPTTISQPPIDLSTASKSPIPDIGTILPEFIISGVEGDGLVRKTSLKRPRSDSGLKLDVSSNPSTAPDTPPSFDFLPPLKHQPLTKPKRSSPSRVSFAALPTTIPSSSSSTTVPASSFSQPFRPALKADYSFPSPNGPITITPVAAHNSVHPAMHTFHGPPRAPRSSLLGLPSLPLTSSGRAADEALNTKPLAKMFVICCKCKFWHDMPSKLYEAMALPKHIEGQSEGRAEGGAAEGAKGKGKGKAVEGKVFTTVTCPWCEHGMSTGCCAGWTAIVYLHERHH